MNELTNNIAALINPAPASKGAQGLFKSFRTEKNADDESDSFANFLIAPSAEDIKAEQKNVSLIAFRAAYKTHLLESTASIKAEIDNLSAEQTAKLRALLKHLAEKLVNAQQNGEVKLSSATEEKLTAFLEGDADINDFIDALNDPAFFADLQSALAKISPSNDQELAQKILEDLKESNKELLAKQDSRDASEIKAEDIAEADQESNVTTSETIEQIFGQIISFLQGPQNNLSAQAGAQTDQASAVNFVPHGDAKAHHARSESASVDQKIQANIIDAQKSAEQKQQVGQINQTGIGSKGLSKGFIQQSFDAAPKVEDFKADMNRAFGALNHATAEKTMQVMQAATKSAPHPATQQVAIQMSRAAGGDTNEFRIQLNPRELGQVDVRMSIDKDGRTRAVVLVEKPETLAILQRDVHNLERALQSAGLNTSSQDLAFGLKDQKANYDFARMMGKGGKGKANGDGSGDLEAIMPQDITQQIFNEYQVNYKA